MVTPDLKVHLALKEIKAKMAYQVSMAHLVVMEIVVNLDSRVVKAKLVAMV